MMVGSKAAWVRLERVPEADEFDGYPEKTLAQWHREHGLS
jgi:hypothetical protein